MINRSLVAQLKRERAAAQRVRDLHRESEPINRAGWTKCVQCSRYGQKPLPIRYPCPTIRALDGDEQERMHP